MTKCKICQAESGPYEQNNHMLWCVVGIRRNAYQDVIDMLKARYAYPDKPTLEDIITLIKEKYSK